MPASPPLPWHGGRGTSHGSALDRLPIQAPLRASETLESAELHYWRCLDGVSGFAHL